MTKIGQHTIFMCFQEGRHAVSFDLVNYQSEKLKQWQKNDYLLLMRWR